MENVTTLPIKPKESKGYRNIFMLIIRNTAVTLLKDNQNSSYHLTIVDLPDSYWAPPK